MTDAEKFCEPDYANGGVLEVIEEIKKQREEMEPVRPGSTIYHTLPGDYNSRKKNLL